jgi:hypothetical protein
MGRSVASIRQRAKGIAERWEQSARVLARDDRPCGEDLAGLVKKHTSDVFYGCNEPLEAAIFSALVEIAKARDVCRDQGPGRNPGLSRDTGFVQDYTGDE